VIAVVQTHHTRDMSLTRSENVQQERQQQDLELEHGLMDDEGLNESGIGDVESSLYCR